ncbi:MAG: sacsin N-terminal ATP-binding-like domain-containing protein [Frankiaceae bacterium]
MSADPFGTDGIRRRALAGWAAAVSRFREDANAEEDHAIGGYRDRLVVELAQNAADAAARAGVPGRLRLRLDGDLLTAANTGAPLDRAGVEALATLRASAKRDGSTAGRFGVGFAAVLAVSDEPAVVSAGGAVRWSLARARELAAGIPAVAAEVEARGGAVPVLRLPLDWPDPPRPPAGYDTEVRLPLRAGTHALARRLLLGTDVTLLLTLPALAEIEVVVDGSVRRLAAVREPDGDVVVDDGGAVTRWRTVSAGGQLAAELLADRPAEERARRAWSVTWAVPVDDAGAPRRLPAGVDRVVRAPTVTDERLGLPALLVASLPLDPARRRVAPGPLRDAVARWAGEAYARLAASVAAGPAVLDLVPVGLPESEVDGLVRGAALAALAETPLLAPAAAGAHRLRGRDAVALEEADGGLAGALAPLLPGLLAADWSGRSRSAALAALGVRRLPLADVVDALAGLDRPPAWWRELYDALAGAVPPGPARDALGALPVPLTDGRLVTGARGLLVPDGDAGSLAGLAPLGVRVVHPDAAHPLLRALGAVPAGPRDVLDDPRVAAAVAASYDADDPAPVADAVLALVVAAGVAPGELPWLGELALPGADGDWYVASELLLPGGALAGLVTGDAPFGVAAAELVERWGPAALAAVGVLDGFAMLRDHDVPVDPDLTDELGHHLDDEAGWLAELVRRLPPGDGPAVLPELVAVRDLELVADGAWPAALAMLAAPPLRAAVVEPARVVLPGGRGVDVPPYAAWWLAGRPVLAGRRPRDWALEPLGGLYEPAPGGLDVELLLAIGVVAGLAEAVGADPAGVVARLGDPARTIDRATVRAAHLLLADVDPERFEPPELVRAVRADGALAAVDATTAVIVDAPDLLPLVGRRPVVPVRLDAAVALADALAVPLASELGAFAVRSRPVATLAWADLPGAALAAARAGGLPPTLVAVHGDLLADDADGTPVRVRWRSAGSLADGVDHVRSGDAAALGRALAWRCGAWPVRAALAEALAATGEGAEPFLEVEDDLG